jgi:hypothetical protein
VTWLLEKISTVLCQWIELSFVLSAMQNIGGFFWIMTPWRWIPAFRRNMLPPFSASEYESVCSVDALISIFQDCTVSISRKKTDNHRRDKLEILRFYIILGSDGNSYVIFELYQGGLCSVPCTLARSCSDPHIAVSAVGIRPRLWKFRHSETSTPHETSR